MIKDLSLHNLKQHKVLIALLLVIFLLGALFRLTNLEKKIYWQDETYTLFQVSGYTEAEVLQNNFSGRILTVEELQQYQKLKPNRGFVGGVSDLVNTLATEDSQHPPLYLILLRGWMECFGNSKTAVRTFSALTSILALPAAYWLGWELYRSSVTAWIFTILVAVSPQYVLYASEAREYSIWMLGILLSSAALLRAMRLNRSQDWGFYAIALAFGLYAHLLSVFVAIAHGVYVVLRERFSLTRNAIAYLIASAIGVLLFSPWIWVIISGLQRLKATTTWAEKKLTLLSLAKLWARNLSYAFFDLQLDYDRPWIYFIPPLILLISYAFYFICRRSPREIWLFVLILGGVPTLFLAIPDLLSGGIRSATDRYLFPLYISTHLAVAYLFSFQIFEPRISSKFRQLWRAIAVLTVSASLFSCVVLSQATVWRNKGGDYYNPEMARIINQSESPLVLGRTGQGIGRIMALSHALDPQVRLSLAVDPKVPQISPSFKTIYAFNPSDYLEEDLTSKGYKLEPRFKSRTSNLYQIQP